jgi:hypothetical protein
MYDNHAFAPEWVSVDLGISIADFSEDLKDLDLDLSSLSIESGVSSILFEKCSNDFKVVDLILEEDGLSTETQWVDILSDDMVGDDRLTPATREVVDSLGELETEDFGLGWGDGSGFV